MASMRFKPTKGGQSVSVTPQPGALTSPAPINPTGGWTNNPETNAPQWTAGTNTANAASTGSQEIRVHPEVLDNNVPVNYVRTIEIIAPNFYQPRDVQDILSAPVYLPKWQLYTTMEVMWPRLIKNMDFLKQSVSSKPFVLKPFEEQDDEKDSDVSSDNVGYGDAQQKYAVVKQALDNLQCSTIYNRNGFKEMVNDIVDSYGKGLSVQQIFWEQQDDVILPVNTQYVNAYYFKYDLANNAITAMSGEPLDDNRFIVSAYRNRSSLNMTALGVYQALAYMWVGQFWTRKFWLQSVEKYGQPYRTVEYPQGSSAALKAALASAMASFGNSGYGVFPAGSNFQLIESAIASGQANAHQLFIEECDKTCDLVMLGQSLTTETGAGGKGGGSRALGEVHERKENHIVENLTDFAVSVLNDQFIPAILDVNGFDLENKPVFQVSKDVDLDMLTKKVSLIQQLRGIGLKADSEALTEELQELGIEISEMTPEEVAQHSGIDNKSSDKSKTPSKKDKPSADNS